MKYTVALICKKEFDCNGLADAMFIEDVTYLESKSSEDIIRSYMETYKLNLDYQIVTADEICNNAETMKLMIECINLTLKMGLSKPKLVVEKYVFTDNSSKPLEVFFDSYYEHILITRR